jgi:hypothetical protein
MRPDVPSAPRNARLARGDHLLALGAFTLASLVYSYPLATSPARANRFDSPDALLNAWIVSWNLHQLARDPLHLFDANIFYPERDSLAYSENLLTAALFASPVALVSDSKVLLFNTVLLLGFVTTAYATFLLGHGETGSRLAAGLAAILFAFAPYRFAHLPHLQLQLAFGIPLILWCARRVLSSSTSSAAALGMAACLPLTFGSSVYYFVFAATVLPIVALFELWELRELRSLRQAGRLLAGLGLGALLTLPLALPYWRKFAAGTVRSLDAASIFSASALDYLSSPARLLFFLPRTSEPLFPGFVALGLAGFAVVASIRDRSRPFLWIAIAALGVWISFGPSAGLFSILHELLPPYRALRVPSRAGILFLLGVAMLAARGWVRIRSARLRGTLAALALAECYSGPLAFRQDVPEMPAIYRALGELPDDGALVELPMPPPERFQDNAVYVFRSAFHFRKLVNGYSGFVPESYREAQILLSEKELALGLRELSRRGVRYVLAHEGRLGPRRRREIEAATELGVLVLLAENALDRLYEIRSVD